MTLAYFILSPGTTVQRSWPIGQQRIKSHQILMQNGIKLHVEQPQISQIAKHMQKMMLYAMCISAAVHHLPRLKRRNNQW